MSAAKRLIVNAEGLGESDAINRGVAEAHRRGIVTSANFTVNGAAAAAVPALAQNTPALGIGLQLAFSATQLEQARPDELAAEARAQLRRFRELIGRDPTHLDLRDRAHGHPGAFEALLVLAWETGFPVRNVSRDVHERLRREGLRTTDQVLGEFHGEAATLEALVQLIGELPFGTSELACRPALGEAAGEGAAAAGRAALDALTHREARQTLQAAGVRLIHYGDL